MTSGQRIGPYEVRERIGAGGMGEVWLGHDAKLRRDAALKVLPEGFASDRERLARFRREAQVLASLNHPNIAQIYGLHEEPGQPVCLAMEYVAGEDLQQRLQRERALALGLPIDEALNIATQICDALEHAHGHGVIHRDLKPANVKVTPEGKVKVLDFGLAKAFAGEGASAAEASPNFPNVNANYDSQSPTVAPTLTASPTIPGVILGTAAYMSPEQARGKPVDKRTDIWAFGCVLYELLTGRQVFTGQSTVEILGALQHQEPDWLLLPAGTPAFARGILRRCLQKDKFKRLASAGDISIQIQDAAAGASLEGAQAGGLSVPVATALVAEKAALEAKFQATVGRATKKVRVLASVASVAIVALGVSVAAWMMRPASAPPQPVSRLTISLPPGQHLAALDQPAIAISPDGKNIVYVALQSRAREQADTSDQRANTLRSAQPGPLADARGSVTQMLYLRPLDSDESRLITGTEGAVSPFFSPDGQWVGFFADNKLKKVSINGGASVTLANAANPGGASWSNQGRIFLQGATTSGLQQVAQEGGAILGATRVGIGGTFHRWPEFLPDGQGIIFAASPAVGTWNNAQILMFQLSTGGEVVSLAQGTQPRYTASGHLLYAQGGALVAAPFDLHRQALTGSATPVLQRLMQSIGAGSAQYSVSSTGTLVYLAGGVSGSQSRMVWVSRNGSEEFLPATARAYSFPQLSPDGRRVTMAIADQDQQIWVYDIARDTSTRLTFEGNANGTPAWTRDGRRIAFYSNRADSMKPGNLYVQAADGSGGAEQLNTSEFLQSPSSVSPDGKLLAFSETTVETGRDIWVMNLTYSGGPAQSHKGQPFLNTRAEETAPKFSPDGKWLAYSSDESGRREIYVQPYPGPGGKWQISTDGGQEPVWNPKGGELFYRSGNKMMAVDVNQSRDLEGAVAGFSAGKPHMLFEGSYLPTLGSFPFYDVSPDGQRFLMLKPVEMEASAPTQINVVLNWFEELRQKALVK